MHPKGLKLQWEFFESNYFFAEPSTTQPVHLSGSPFLFSSQPSMQRFSHTSITLFGAAIPQSNGLEPQPRPSQNRPRCSPSAIECFQD